MSACKSISFVFTWDFHELGDDDGDEEVEGGRRIVVYSSYYCLLFFVSESAYTKLGFSSFYFYRF